MSQQHFSAAAANNPYPTTTSIYQCGGKDVKVHAISTGSISVKKNFMMKKGPGFISKLNILLGREYVPYLPIWVFIIEHPEGIIMIDTGDSEAASHDQFYDREEIENRFNLYAMANRRMISRDDELDVQLSKLNIKSKDISKIVLTHLHGDHVDGVKFFPENEFILNELEHKHPYGYLPTTMPAWFKPTLVNLHKTKIEYFDSASPLTKSGDVLLVSTPGHTKNHCAVLFKTDHEHILFAGDLTYQQYQLSKFEMAAAHQDYNLSASSMKKTMEYAKNYPLVYLPSHDYDSSKRLLSKDVIMLT